MKQIKYKEGFKYQLDSDFIIATGISLDKPYTSQFIDIDMVGMLIIKSGYAWDGPSGPTVDRKTNMRGSLVHDALYQLMRQGTIHRGYRKRADKLFVKLCKEDGMWSITAWLDLKALRKFAKSAASAKSCKKVLIAP